MTEQGDEVNNDSTIPSKVLDFNAKKKRGRPKKKDLDGDKDPIKADLYEEIFENITGGDTSTPTLPKPDFKIEAYELEPGLHQSVLVGDKGECQLIRIQKVKQLIHSYCWNALVNIPHFHFTPKQSETAAEHWSLRVTPIEKPVSVLFKNEPGLCMRRIHFDLIPNINGEMTPLFDEIFKRVLTNGNQLKAFIWSILIPNSDCGQYVWMRGEGDDSKGALTRAIMHVLGASKNNPGPIVTMQNSAPCTKNKHWATPFVNKRLVVFPDLEDSRTMSNGVIKALTGDDMVHIDPKFIPAYDTKLDCKMLFSSQNLPVMTGKHADLKRLILVEMKQFDSTKHDPQYEPKLWAELPYFLDDCRLVYERLCPDNGRILVDEIAKQIMSDDFDDYNSDLQSVFNEHFIAEDGATITPQQVTDCLMESHSTKDPQYQKRFKTWLRQAHPVNQIKRVRCHQNLAIKKTSYYKVPYPIPN